MNGDDSILQHLSKFVTTERLLRMQHVLSQRTKYVSVVLEDIYQAHNASAVLRSCDAFGVQNVHIIEKRNEYRINPEIALGSTQWLSLHKHIKEAADTTKVLTGLKADGYRIVATSPHSQGHTLYDLPLDKGPIALMFGTELTGLSQEALDLADDFLTIPMYGFVESFNISVSVAICLSHLCNAIRTQNLPWALTTEEKDQILFEWLMGSVKHSDVILREFNDQK